MCQQQKSALSSFVSVLDYDQASTLREADQSCVQVAVSYYSDIRND